jgi:NAD(P)-dependent dehydrogenase (short-subunit alcohol dehydrogenase family)
MSSDALADRTILITGGTGGVGLAAARAFLARGASVIIGSRDPARYASSAKELGEDGVHPFIADITDPAHVERGLDVMYRSGLQPTDVIHSAAGGMEPVLRDLVRLMTGLRRLRGEEMDRAHAAARDELAQLVAGTRDYAMTVNCAAPSMLLDAVVARMAPGGSVTFYSHLWASLYPHRQIPIYYEAVAESKHALEAWLADRSREWESRHITTAVISSTVIGNTRMGYLLDRFCAEPMPPADRERWRSTYVSCSELVEATLGVVESAGQESSGGLVRLYLSGPGVIVQHLKPDDSPMQYPIPLARNAPLWSEVPT